MRFALAAVLVLVSASVPVDAQSDAAKGTIAINDIVARMNDNEKSLAERIRMYRPLMEVYVLHGPEGLRSVARQMRTASEDERHRRSSRDPLSIVSSERTARAHAAPVASSGSSKAALSKTNACTMCRRPAT